MTDDVLNVIIRTFSETIGKMQDFPAVSVTLDGAEYSLSLWSLTVSFFVFSLIVLALRHFFGGGSD